MFYHKRLATTLEEFNATGPFSLGRAVTGLKSANGGPACYLKNDAQLLFFPGPVLGGLRTSQPVTTVPLKAITGIEFQDQSSITQQTQRVMTKTKTKQHGWNFFLVRTHGKNTPKYKTVKDTIVDKRFVLQIDWVDEGYATSATFAFEDSNTAYSALSTLRSAVGPIASTEKTCPYCAETIKVAAVKCKHCGADLVS